eukprot:1158811-Pelagomonas_calceolata.AAC.6
MTDKRLIRHRNYLEHACLITSKRQQIQEWGLRLPACLDFDAGPSMLLLLSSWTCAAWNT